MTSEEITNAGTKKGYRVFTLEMKTQTVRMLNMRLRMSDNVIDEGLRMFPHEDSWSQKVLSEGTEVVV